jgi:uncharacterized protein
MNDFANCVSRENVQKIENYLLELKLKTGVEVAIVTVSDLRGLYIELYAVELFKEWGIGNKKTDEGLLILVSLKEKKVRVEVGYGCESYITDSLVGSILDDKIVELIINDKFSDAVVLLFYEFSSIITKHYGVQLNGQIYNSNNNANEQKLSKIQLIILSIIFVFLVIVTKGKIIIWILLILSNSGGNHFGGSRSSRGFGGFGGGHSGGGGAAR